MEDCDSNEAVSFLVFHEVTMKLIERLTGSPNQLEVIWILWRRTTEPVSYLDLSHLAIQVYHHPSSISHFQIRALTYFPNDVCQSSSLLLKILSSIVNKITYESFGNSNEELSQQPKKVLVGHRYLFFIDKLWYNTRDWDDLKRYFPDNGNGSRIVFCSLSLLEPAVSPDFISQPWPRPPRVEDELEETCGGVQLYFVRAQPEEYEIISDDGSSSIAMSNGTVKEEMMVGFEDEVMKLVDRLTGLQKQLEVISIVGMPGLGKTTLSRQVYNHPNVLYHFYVRAWTRVSQVYQKRDLLLGILGSIIELMSEIHNMSDGKLLELLKKRLLGHRYLIVTDDMWDFGAWDDLQRCFPDN